MRHRWRCCSTDAGSVSPCTTSRRRRSARYSPGTSCHTGSPWWSPKAIAAVGLGLGEEDAPAVVGHLDVVEVGPALLADGDRRAQVDVVVLEGDRAELLPPVDELRLPRLERPLQPPVAGEVDVVRDLGVDVDGGHRARPPHTLVAVVGRARAGAEAAQRAVGADGVGALEDPVLPRREAGEDLRLHRLRADEAAGWPPSPVSASGEKLLRSSSISRTSSSQSMSSGVNVTSSASAASAASRSLPMRAAGRVAARRRGPRTGSPGGTGRWTSGTSRRWRR